MPDELMINFNAPVVARPPVAITTEVPVVRETLTVKKIQRKEPVPRTASWESIRDYVIAAVERIHGPFPRDIRKENTIFMAFAARWQELAEPIARYAFEESEGLWKGSPVSVFRFHRTSDSYFSQPIAELLNA